MQLVKVMSERTGVLAKESFKHRDAFKERGEARDQIFPHSPVEHLIVDSAFPTVSIY